MNVFSVAADAAALGAGVPSAAAVTGSGDDDDDDDAHLTGLQYLERHEAQQAVRAEQRRQEREALFSRVLDSLGGPDGEHTLATLLHGQGPGPGSTLPLTHPLVHLAAEHPARVAQVPTAMTGGPDGPLAFVDSGLNIRLPPAPDLSAEVDLSVSVPLTEEQERERAAHRAALAQQKEAMLQVRLRLRLCLAAAVPLTPRPSVHVLPIADCR